MSEVLPEVRMVCLYADRPQFLRRFLASFRAQTYPNLRLLVYDNGREPMDTRLLNPDGGDREIWINAREASHLPARSIGMLRNQANSWANADIIAHADVDDVSHPNRIAEQVTLLQASGADCVGYSDMLFWRDAMTAAIQGARAHERLGMDVCGNPTLFPTREPYSIQYAENHADIGRPFFGEAWLYLGPQKALGTSLCYWRATWERKPFPDQPRPGHANGEDTDWIKGLELRAVPSTGSLESLYVHFVEVPSIDGVRQYEPGKMTVSGDPRMIASIHGANTSGSYKLIADSTSWRRVPEWDSYCRKAMTL